MVVRSRFYFEILAVVVIGIDDAKIGPGVRPAGGEGRQGTWWAAASALPARGVSRNAHTTKVSGAVNDVVTLHTEQES